MGKKKLTLEEVKSILKIEVDKSILHIQHTETGTGTTESQVFVYFVAASSELVTTGLNISFRK